MKDEAPNAVPVNAPASAGGQPVTRVAGAGVFKIWTGLVPGETLQAHAETIDAIDRVDSRSGPVTHKRRW